MSWTIALLSPIPQGDGVSQEHSTLLFYIHKITHLAGYGLFASLTAWIITPASRGPLLLFLLMHATLVEFCQTWVPGRYATLHDVGLNMVGLVLGVLATRSFWRTRHLRNG